MTGWGSLVLHAAVVEVLSEIFVEEAVQGFLCHWAGHENCYAIGPAAVAVVGSLAAVAAAAGAFVLLFL